MLNEPKVGLMTRLAIYDKRHGISKKAAAKCFKTDYVTFGVLKTIFTTTISFFILVGLYILYNGEEFMANINSLDYVAMGRMFFGYYCMLLVVYIVVSLVVYSVKYDRSKNDVKKYYANLKRLEKLSDK